MGDRSFFSNNFKILPSARALSPLLLVSMCAVGYTVLHLFGSSKLPILLSKPRSSLPQVSYNISKPVQSQESRPSPHHEPVDETLAAKTAKASHGELAKKNVLLVGLPEALDTTAVSRSCPKLAARCSVTRRDPGPLHSTEEFDAIAFKVSSMVNRVGDDSWIEDFPRSRSAKQVFVFYSREAPLKPHNFIYARHKQARDFPYSLFKDYFNWTWTYRSDSDIVDPFAQVYPINWKASNYDEKKHYMLNHKWINYNPKQFKLSIANRSEQFKALANKPGKVVWIVSHCFTRESVLNIISNFKFYLAFENSICKDYVTEKTFRRLGRILPVVMGGADYTRVLPPHSYIDAGKHSPAELARLLHRLDQDQEEYLSYFWWMDHYSPTIYMNSAMPICQLCRKLVAGDPGEGRMSSSVDLEKWWWEGSQCREYQHWWPPSTD